MNVVNRCKDEVISITSTSNPLTFYFDKDNSTTTLVNAVSLFSLSPSICPFTSYTLYEQDPVTFTKNYAGTDIVMDPTTYQLTMDSTNFKLNMTIKALSSQSKTMYMPFTVWKCGAETLFAKNSSRVQVDLVYGVSAMNTSMNRTEIESMFSIDSTVCPITTIALT